MYHVVNGKVQNSYHDLLFLYNCFTSHELFSDMITCCTQSQKNWAQTSSVVSLSNIHNAAGHLQHIDSGVCPYPQKLSWHLLSVSSTCVTLFSSWYICSALQCLCVGKIFLRMTRRGSETDTQTKEMAKRKEQRYFYSERWENWLHPLRKWYSDLLSGHHWGAGEKVILIERWHFRWCYYREAIMHFRPVL